MTNEVFQDRPGNARFVKLPSAVSAAGTPILVGTMAGVTVDAYDSSLGGATVRFSGSFLLTIRAQSTQSPNAGKDILPGDELFASGTLDATTNVTYNLTIDGTRGNVPFGNLDPSETKASAAAGVDVLKAVKLKESGSGVNVG